MKTRFAPAPTGYLHLGGARTALFSWLYARKNKGKFVLRIEDTDIKREKEDAVSGILEGLKWLGIDWDEGPYFQSKRLNIYQEYANILLKKQKAYYCFCTKRELEIRRYEAAKLGLPPGYDGKCRSLTREERSILEKKRKPSIRFLVPDCKIVFSDLIRGELEFDSKTISDFIILRSDGIPTYNFACVIDDSLMEITDVIRGEDHISNTPKQILLYNALGFKIPQFAHLPLIFGPDKTPLSKRHGAMDVLSYRERGFLPNAMINYISLLGFSTEDSKQIMSKDELISLFSFVRVQKGGAIFDLNKLLWMNGEYIRKEDRQKLIELSLDIFKGKDREWQGEVIELFRERIKTISDLKKEADFLLEDEIEIDKKAEEDFLKKDGVLNNLKATLNALKNLEPFTKETTEKTLRELALNLNVKTKEIFHPLRVVVTGRSVSPPLFDTLSLLGKKLVLKRLNFAIFGRNTYS
ncbi:MAG: glutamate--tRNA ligase [bacterium]